MGSMLNNKFESFGDHSGQFGSNKMLVLLLEKPKPPKSTISGFVDPWETLIIDLNIPEYFHTNTEIWNRFRVILFL